MMADDEDYEYEYSYSDEEEDDYEYDEYDDGMDISRRKDQQQQHPCSNDSSSSSSSSTTTTTICDENANPNAPPSSSSSSLQHVLSTSPRTSSSTWVVKRPAISMMPAEKLLLEMKHRLAEIADVLCVPYAAAAPLLRGHRWSKQTLLENYTSDSSGVLEKAGVWCRCHCRTNSNNQSPSIQNDNSATATTITTTLATECLICFDTLENGDTKKLSMGCGHEFCMDCWHDYLVNAIEEDGATCVLATCPQSECNEVLTEEEVQHAAPELLPKFQHFQLRSFVESNALSRWCPGKKCEYIALCEQTRPFQDDEDQVANCECGTSFCIVCGEEPHTPINCKDLSLWNDKCSIESETANWITANTKTCPNCSSRINKDGGCMYVTCQKCRHGFCWVCMGTHHVWQCNAYKEADADKTRAKNDLERYLHYYQRYHGHGQAQKFARKQLDKMKQKEDCNFQEADKSSSVPNTAAAAAKNNDDGGDQDLRFLVEANRQLVQCRRVLKYTYVFAYYHFISETTSTKSQTERFEHHQGILEGLTEGLSELTEKSIGEIDRTDVINRTRVIGQFIRNVLEYVDGDMDEDWD